MNKGAKALWFFTLLLLLVGIAGVIAGVVGDSWWEKNNNGGNNVREGLWRTCHSGICENRDNILRFDEDYRGNLYDLIKCFYSVYKKTTRMNASWICVRRDC